MVYYSLGIFWYFFKTINVIGSAEWTILESVMSFECRLILNQLCPYLEPLFHDWEN